MKHLLGLLQYDPFDVSIKILLFQEIKKLTFGKNTYNNTKFCNEEFPRVGKKG